MSDDVNIFTRLHNGAALNFETLQGLADLLNAICDRFHDNEITPELLAALDASQADVRHELQRVRVALENADTAANRYSNLIWGARPSASKK